MGAIHVMKREENVILEMYFIIPFTICPLYNSELSYRENYSIKWGL
jgi:hypothetical protein